jgi:DNA-3-methyladenine glycosylase
MKGKVCFLYSEGILPKTFYERDPVIVARSLLGKRLIRKLSENLLAGIVVETEAYSGLEDPASRAFHGVKKYNRLMWDEPGRAFIYNVHKYWMLNIVAHERNQIGAVLIRAIEPTDGLGIMLKNRPVTKVRNLTNGPGKLTSALKIDKRLNGVYVVSFRNEIAVINNEIDFEIGCSPRIGVRTDLPQNLRFFILGNKFVSR